MLVNGDVYFGLDLDAQDRIVVAGRRDFGIDDLDGLIVRYSSDGAPDTAFGTFLTGELASDEFRAVKTDGSGRIVAGGSVSWSSSEQDGFSVRLNADGTADNCFGTNGFSDLTTPSDMRMDVLHDVLVDSLSNVVLCGETFVSGSGSTDWLLARYRGN